MTEDAAPAGDVSPPPAGDASPAPAGDVSLRAVAGAAIVDDLAAPTRLLAARRTEPPALAGSRRRDRTVVQDVRAEMWDCGASQRQRSPGAVRYCRTT